MAADYKVPLQQTVTTTTSAAALDTAVKSAVEALIVASTTVPQSISLGPLVTYTSGSFTWATTIFYTKLETL